MKNKKGFAHILFVLLLTVVSIGIVTFLSVSKQVEVSPPPAPTSTTPAEMSNWKTYRNEEYGFEFRYPGEWEILESTNEVQVLEPNSLGNLSIRILKNPSDRFTSQSKNYTIGQYDTLEISREPYKNLDYGQVELQAESDDGKVISADFTYSVDNKKGRENTIAQILSTFEFTN